MAIVPYTTSAKIQTQISSDGLSLRVDDDATRTAQAIADASIEMDGYCLPAGYTQAGLLASNWAEMKVRQLAIWNLCLDRLNPAPQSAQIKYEKTIKDLEGVQSGKFRIPDAAVGKSAAPVISNLHVKQTGVVPITAVDTGRSTGTPAGYDQFTDRIEQTYNYDL